MEDQNKPPHQGDVPHRDHHGGPHHHEHHHHGESHQKHEWKLNVQGVLTEWHNPEVLVRDAIKKAGFNPDTPWIIILKVAGEPRREVNLTSVIDLRHKSIEKLRLTPRQINNGEVRPSRRLDFAMLAQDEEHLRYLGLRWETVVDGGRRWLIIRGYQLPPGYNVPAADIAIEVPASYPTAQLDMFYCRPILSLQAGRPIPQTQHSEAILGATFQRWSRHRQWDAGQDTLATHLALVDESLCREVGQ